MSSIALLLAAFAVLAAGGLASALLRAQRAAALAGAAGGIAGAVLAGGAALVRLLGDGEPVVTLPWSIPGGPFELGLDPLGAWFCLVVAAVAAPIALHAWSYVGGGRRPYGGFGCNLNLLLGALLLLAAARDLLVFVAAWELMTVGAYFAIAREHDQPYVRWAARLYLVANHGAAYCLLGLAAWLAASAGSLRFDAIPAAAALPAGLPFLLALIAFGTKAGIVPLHIWLPHAHPVAPSPVSALLSGLVIKAGIFGLLRFLPLLSPPPVWPGALLLALGIASALLGVLYALAQHELKRLLAYHSVENIGIILLGAGVGMIGARAGSPLIATLGFCGALLHLLNHALFKALLFLAAGGVIRQRGTGQIDQLGGVAQAMPWTAAMFLVGCVSICGLPPMNGFASEWTVYRALFGAAAEAGGAARLWAAGGILALALVGGLAAACFAKALAAVFLGTPRAAARAAERDAPRRERIAMLLLALGCVSVGLAPQWFVRLAWPAASRLSSALGAGPPVPAAPTAAWLQSISVAGLLLVAAIAALALLRRGLGARPGARVPTWSCGYALPQSRMQYTASSFAAGLLAVFRRVLWTRVQAHPARGLFARAPSLHTDTPDAAEEYAYRPAFTALQAVARPFRWLQRGPVQVRILMIMIALGALLAWKVTLR